MAELIESKSPKGDNGIVKSDDVEEAVENNPDLAPHEIALSFDHILAQIFGSLDTPSLFTCRLVSHRFLHFARRPLEKRIQKTFYNVGRDVKDGTERSLAQLTEFLKQSASASESHHNPISFPCINFMFDGVQLDNDILQKFLNINGPAIRRPEILYFENTTHEDIITHQLCNLLTVQVPNLENLYLGGEFSVGLQHGIQGPINRKPTLQKTDPEFEQISTRVKSLPRKSNLKILGIYGGGDGVVKTMEFLLQLSPGLQEFYLHNSSFYLSKCLLERFNRVHLIKSLNFQPSMQPESNSHSDVLYFCLDAMEKISLSHNLRLRELRICFHEVHPLCETNPKFVNKVALMINRILEGSKDTLEIITFVCFYFLRGMKMPTPMSRVREIHVESCSEHSKSDANARMFPKGFSWTETFPKLTCVEVSNFSYNSDKINVFMKFLNCWDFGGYRNGTALTDRIHKVIMADSECFRGPTCRVKIPPLMLQRIKQLFQSAELEADADDESI